MGVGAVGKVGLLFRFNEGRLAGLRKRYECSAGTIQYLGFVGGLKGRKYRAFHPRELVGFIFTVGVENKEGKIIVSRITADKKQRQKNATLKNKRNKSDCCADGTVCYYCSKSRKECSLSCHWSRWEKKDCPNGHTAWFDREICLFCAESLYKRAAGVYSFKPE